MNEPFRYVVGLEVHVQLLTRTKLFCGCSTQFGLPPNSATCPVCLGMPGVLPVMNQRAFALALRAALALNCTISSFTKWDRKNYYYPDLPKNYQISQYDLPFSSHGWLEVPGPEGQPKAIRITRAHLEEDAGKSIHDESGRGGDSRVDLNRTGTPLVEIVSEPDIATPEEARAYLEELRLMLRELEVSDCEMQEGSLRCDANVNIHIPQADGSHIATPIVEVKNLNSIRAVERAIKYEGQRQYEQYQKTKQKFGDVPKETRGWDDARGKTLAQRRKEEASDYRYFPEPDLVPVQVDEPWVQEVRQAMGELPAEQRQRLQQAPHQLSDYDARVLAAQGRKFVAFYEEVVRQAGDAKATANFLTNTLLAKLNAEGLRLTDSPISAERAGDLVTCILRDGLNKQAAQKVFDHMWEHPDATAAAAMKAAGLEKLSPEQIRDLVRQAIANNPKAVEDFKKGKKAAANSFKGPVMRQTKGMADAAAVDQMIQEELANL